ncbi:hypothetical protein CANCADRAFT_134403 [Tortispora caseinolytica NRRL Y-17796]|uniref:Fluoride ion transporter CrcB n=1 Tax=Tortispora caseinolytica NRRL Y-17796 TaxID=767744 RepID=A0A1E4TBM4_9ASCO|nr:hypothetical protein CANCADRAFT_134403 [Tortispora caseinolytica NRRL Y-17796]
MKQSSSAKIQLGIAAWIIVFSFWGTFTRVGVGDLSNYSGRAVFASAWVQFVGCVTMGFANASLKSHKSHEWTKSTQIFSKSIIVGYCGSTTSFSTYIVDLFYALANVSDFAGDHARGYNVLTFLTVLIGSIAFSMFGMGLGIHIGSYFDLMELPDKLPYPEEVGVALAVFHFAACALLVGLVPNSRTYTYSALFGPFGALLRWKLGDLNTKSNHFFWGTWAANMIGTTVICILIPLQGFLERKAASHFTSVNICEAMLALEVGFCGGLTTISTFIAEIDKLRIQGRGTRITIYYLASVVPTLMIAVIALGIAYWGFDELPSSTCFTANLSGT